MALINLQTNLRNLKYGNDRIYGGSSGQPYITTPIPNGTSDVGNANYDFILKGGINAITDSATDVLRLSKMFTDLKTPNGLFFTTKQNLLSRTAVQTQTSDILNGGIYTPLSTLAEAGIVAFGSHLLKQGRNPFDDTGAYATNNFNLYGPYIINQKTTQPSGEDRLVNLYNTLIVSSSNDINILSYDGGPGSDLGIGSTNIRFADQRTGINNVNGKEIINGTYQTTRMVRVLKNWIPYNGATNAYNLFNKNNDEVSNLNSTIYSGTYSYEPGISYNVYKTGSLETDTTVAFTNDSLTYTQNQLNALEGGDLNKDIRGSLSSPGAPKTQDFRAILRQGLISSSIMSNAPLYNVAENKTIEGRVNMGDPGNSTNKNLISYTNGGILNSNKIAQPVDKITALALYSSTAVDTSDIGKKITNDLVKFRIASIHNNNPSQKTFMHFRAALNNFSDSYNATWNSATYLGRGENFYTYSNFTRTISLSWTIAAQSKQELIPIYKKLNYLASNIAPDYTNLGYMTGNLVQLIVGGYLYEQVGIITGLVYDIQEDTPWEIGINDDATNYDSSVKELPHVIRVSSFTFIPIQNFIPAKQSVNGNTAASIIDNNEYGPERFIALNNGTIYNNYDS